MRDFYRNLSPMEKGLLWVGGIAVILVVVAFGDANDGIAAGAQVAAAVGTFILAGLAYSQVREMRETRKAQERPHVIVDADYSTAPLVSVFVRNIGRGAAKEITFTFSHPLISSMSEDEHSIAEPLSNLPYLSKGIDYLAPGAEIGSAWDSLITLIPLFEERGLEDGITITSRYRSLDGELYETDWTVNPLRAEGYRFGRKDTEDLVKATGKIAEMSVENRRLREKELDMLTDIRNIHKQLYRPYEALEQLHATRSPAIQETRRRIVRVICEEWENADGQLHSKTVYERLASEGEEPPDNVMSELLEELKELLLIRGPLMLGRDAMATHGNMWITKVDPSLCESSG